MKNNHRPVTKRAFLRRFWGIRYNSHKKLPTRTLDVHISHLRKMIAPYKNLIKTIHTEGYQFNSELANNILPINPPGA